MIVAAIKAVARNGSATDADDARFVEMSLADRAALEVALRLGTSLELPVHVITVGPAAAELLLREALACGATAATHVPAPIDLPSDEVAEQIVAAVADCVVVVCGDHSRDRGSGSVPAFIAHGRGASQALGLVAVDAATAASGAPIRVVRRLDGGRREVLDVTLPCVLSVEGSAAVLRRASLPATLSAAGRTVARRPSVTPRRSPTPVSIAPYRPRPRHHPGPVGDTALDRIRQLTDSTGTRQHGFVVELDPTAAAVAVLDALREWGYLA